TFFYYLGLAVQKASSRRSKPMPLLTPEYLLGIPEFSRNFFAELFGRLKGPAVLVFDNTQEVPGESLLYGAIIEGLARMQVDIRIIMVSRSEPPPQFARLLASRMMKLLGWHDLRLTLEEFTEIARHRGFEEERAATFSGLHTQVDGWAAGLKLVLEGAAKLNGKVALAGDNEPREIFDYFAAEVFERVEPDVQDCLLKIAFLPRIQVPLAEKLSGHERAGLILDDLYRRNFFIVKLARPERTYEYHPLFREFLLTMADVRFSHPDIDHIRKNAAMLLETDGQIEEAMALFRQADDYPNLIRLLLDQAPALVSQGRHQTVERLLNAIPEEVMATTPWLLFWRGAARMSSDPSAGSPFFEQALELFDERGDAAGAFLAWSGAVDAIIYTFDSFTLLDDWMRRFERLAGRYPTFPSPEIEVRVITSLLHILALRQPCHSDFGMWEKRGLSAASAVNDIDLRINICMPLVMAAVFAGDLAKAEKLLLGLKDGIRSIDHCSLAVISLKVMEVSYLWLAGRFEECECAVTKGLELAESTGIKPTVFPIMCHGTSGLLSAGNLSRAKEYLDKMSAFLDRLGRCEKGFYHLKKTWEGLLDQNPSAVLLHAEKSLQVLLEVGMSQAIALAYLAMGYGLHETGKHELAADHFIKAREHSTQAKSRQTEFACLLAEANFAYDLGDDELGVQSLTTALSLGRKHGYFNCYFWRPAVITRLCCKALEAGIQKEYVQELIRQRKLMPESPPSEIETWPWPFRIYTLGRFELVRDGKPVRSNGKGQQKPLALLKALIALGGRNVAEFQLTEALWPDADGDMQHQSLATTLHRLRRLLGEKEAIEYRDGQLSLSACYCWVDAWAFERLLSQAEAESQKKVQRCMSAAAGYAEKAIDLYKGNFLPEDSVEYWCMHKKERLKSRFLRGVIFLGRSLEKSGDQEQAVERYLQALEVDPMVEEFYQRLMINYQRQGRNADAAMIYRRCQENFNTYLKVQPSRQTLAIYNSILSDSAERIKN
ncbi:MAG: hypothetical protein OEL85_06620, partial [Desulfobulbaceae bacterium]|nr:hypothetical protein [Desulfobulbaceae bacterium]